VTLVGIWLLIPLAGIVAAIFLVWALRRRRR
jgi:Na+-driven multidrug efflux pump